MPFWPLCARNKIVLYYFESTEGAHKGGFWTQVRSTGTKDPRPYLGLAGGKLGFYEFHVKMRSKASPTVTTERNVMQVARI